MGQLALAPDSQFHQIAASAGYQFTDKTRGSADIAWGRMTRTRISSPRRSMPASPSRPCRGVQPTPAQKRSTPISSSPPR